MTLRPAFPPSIFPESVATVKSNFPVITAALRAGCAPDGNGLNIFIGKPTNSSPEDLNGKTAAVHIPDTSADFAMHLARKASDFLIVI